ncbi:MAG TPA: histidine kinase dimerization/phospho-acceptor domain-containing protein [Vicinamibacterales bacterium]|nr:histidine kinase dimerization/phospho-acceptor domain-containing protein [Vicinamibacterales bacterium]
MIAIVVGVVLAALLVVRDIYARRSERALMAEIASLRKQVTHTDRLANIGRLVSGLAQDLKSPLQGVLGNAELLAAVEPVDPNSVEELQDIRDNVSRAVGIVRNLLAFTETHALHRRWHDLNDIVRRSVNHRSLDGVRFEETPRLPLVYIDGRQIEKVIAVVLDHSSKYSRSSGNVVIVTRRGADERLAVEIDDPALALPDDAPEWAGELHACRRVFEAHGGVFEVDRRPGGGIRFHLALPVTEQPEGQAQ